MSTAQKRDHFRVLYGEIDRPILLFSARHFEVIDVSEKGFRFSLGTIQGLKIGDAVIGTLTFSDKESFIIRGSIVRIQRKEASVQLITEIPLRKIVSEQRRFLQKFHKFE